MPYAGRGGAGNIQQAQQVPSPALEQIDLEAAESADAPIEIARALAEEKRAQATQEGYSHYIKTGRGGAGNYYEPQATEVKAAQESETKIPHPPRNSSLPTSTGRGGAGNFEQLSSPAKSKDEAEKKELENIRSKAEEDVEKALPRPEKAYVIGADKSMAGREAVATVSILD